MVGLGDERSAGRSRESGIVVERSRRDRRAAAGLLSPQQQNPFTGKLTAPMIDAVLRARALAVSPPA